jgi:hypothetical protein
MSSSISRSLWFAKNHQFKFLLFGTLAITTLYLINHQSSRTKIDNVLNNYKNSFNQFRTHYDTEYDFNLILRYIDLPLANAYGSVIVPLAYAVLKLPTVGDIAEYGSGVYSTNVLHKLTYDLQRNFFSFDTDLEWLMKFALFNETKHHRIYHVSKEDIENHRVNEK